MSTSHVIARTTLLRREAILALTGECKTSLYDKMRKGLIVHPIKIGARAVAWPFDEIEAILKARVQGKSEADIRTLVRRLEAARTSDC